MMGAEASLDKKKNIVLYKTLVRRFLVIGGDVKKLGAI
jgi:hypothetical protein